MKHRTKLAVFLAVLLIAAVIAGVSAFAGGNYGTSTDPLVTLSYLDEVVTPSVLASAQTKIDAAMADLNARIAAQSGEVDSYSVVTLTTGQRLIGGVGCEILLRIGTANCKATWSPGLVDTTTAGSIDNGTALTKNHLYMVTIDGGGIVATAATTKVLVRGPYSIS